MQLGLDSHISAAVLVVARGLLELLDQVQLAPLTRLLQAQLVGIVDEVLDCAASVVSQAQQHLVGVGLEFLDALLNKRLDAKFC